MAGISEALGRPLMPWQRLVADVALEVQSEAAGDPHPGEWAYNDVTVTVQRQAGKTKLLTPVVVHRCGSGPRRRVFGTAQKREKARKRWMDTTDDVLTSPLRGEVRRLTSRMGEQLRWIRTQSTYEPFAPNDDDMHGETPDLVLVDELWAFEKDQAKAVQAAYVPGFVTKDAQAWKLSTAGTDASWWLNTSRSSGRRAVDDGTRLGTAYFEWSLPDRVLVDNRVRRITDLSDEQLVEACIAHHPAAGYTLRPAAVRLAWEQMGGDRAEFLRAYGNRSAEDLAAKWQTLSETTWLQQTEGDTIPESARVALGVWVSEDGAAAAVSAGWRDAAGRMHVEVTQSGDVPDVHDGFRWVAARVAAIAGRSEVSTVALPNLRESRDLADELGTSGVVHVTRVAQADVAAACARHRSELTARTWFHRVSTEATAAAQSASWESGRWGEPGDSIAALGAQTMAGWGADHAPPAPPVVTRFRIR